MTIDNRPTELALETSDVRSQDMTTIDSRELSRLKDKAMLFDSIMEAPCFVTFFTGYDGQGAAIRENLIVKRNHNDNILYNQAMRKAKKLGASSWCVFKPVGVSHNVDYGRYGDESRLDFIETSYDVLFPEVTEEGLK